MIMKSSSARNGTGGSCATMPAGATVKQRIEKTTVDAFVPLFNINQGQDYAVLQYGDAPDAICRNGSGQIIQVEITLTEDNPGDLAWSFGETETRPPSYWYGNCLQRNVLDQLRRRLDAKILKRYGERTALVIRDSSGADWDWEYVAEDIRETMGPRLNPYDMGIWILNRTKSRLFRLA